jgi:carboxypeptidase family protein
MLGTWRTRVGLAVWLILLPGLTFAQVNAGVAGSVKDSTGAVLPGVTVEASSPVLIEKARTAVTDAAGEYKIVELRPGTYSVTFALPGFSTVRREGIELTTGFTATVNAILAVGSVAETITVSGASPVIDLQNTKQTRVMTQEVIETIPTGKQFQSMGALIPGVTLSQGIFNQDVGGMQGGNPNSVMSLHGARPLDQSLLVDGLSVATWSRIDSTNLQYHDGNFQEFAFDYSSQSAEIETAGVRINMIPREGSNRFSGRLHFNVALSSLQSDNITDELRAKNLTDANRSKELWDINPYVGGPIVKDRLWFFGTYTRTRNDYYVAGQYLTNDNTSWIYVPDKTRQAVGDEWAQDTAVRLTWQATARHKFNGYLNRNVNCQCHFIIGNGRQSNAAAYTKTTGWVSQLTWASPLTTRLLLDGGISYKTEDVPWLTEPEATLPQITDLSNGWSFRSYPAIRFQTPNIAFRASMSYVTGSHAMKIGMTSLGGPYKFQAFAIGSLTYTTFNGSPLSVSYTSQPYATENYARNVGIYAQDVWTLKNLTLNGGVRFDYLRAGYPDQYNAPTVWVQTPRQVSGQVAVRWTDLSPRMGASYNLFGNGKTALKASLNRYILQRGPGDVSAPINPMQTNATNTRRWLDPNGDKIVQGDPFNPAENGELGPSTNLNFGKPVASVHNDPDWAFGFGLRPNNWEFSTGVQHELMPRVSVEGMYFRRILGNFAATENQAYVPSDYSTYCVTTPQDPRLPGGGNRRICGLFDLNPLDSNGQSLIGRVNSVITSASNYGTIYEHWNGFDFTTSVRLAKALLQGGLSTGRTVQDNCDITTKNPQVTMPGFAGTVVNFSSGPSASTDFCHVQTPFLTQLKLLGSYTLPLDIQVAATFQNIPGPQIAANATYTSAQIAPSLGRSLSSAASATINIVQAGTLYGERLNQLDLRLTKILKLGGKFGALASVDFFNALNASPVIGLNNTYGATIGATAGSAWQAPFAILSGRLTKVRLQFTF